MSTKIAPQPRPIPKTNAQSTSSQTTKAADGKEKPAAEEKREDDWHVEVGEGRCSRGFGYTLAVPFLMMAVWYTYMMITFRGIIVDPNYDTQAAVDHIVNISVQAGLPLAAEFAPYYRTFLSLYISKDYYLFVGMATAHVFCLCMLGLLVFNLTFVKINQQVFTALAFGNYSLRRGIRGLLTWGKGITAWYLAITFSGLYALPFIIVPIPSKATFDPVLGTDVNDYVKYMHYVYYSASIGTGSVCLIAGYTFITFCFKIFGEEFPDFVYMETIRKQRRKAEHKPVVMPVATPA